ncbi:MAG TPA: tripartite tricarboxylate transporter TctB family protein [Sphaerochaeta sp.]|nr:tripartite tricarboxylate transporter TctB family protein [Sphaerochaeta sp.]
MKKANFIVSGVFAAFALVVIIIASGYPPSKHGVPGPGVFPTIIAVLILISAVVLFLQTLRMPTVSDDVIDLKSRSIINVYVTMAGLILYIALLPTIGFIVSTSAMLIVYIKWFSRRPLWKCALISVLFTLAIFFLFGRVLNVPMRFGVLI